MIIFEISIADNAILMVSWYQHYWLIDFLSFVYVKKLVLTNDYNILEKEINGYFVPVYFKNFKERTKLLVKHQRSLLVQ